MDETARVIKFESDNKEAKKFSLEMKIVALQQLILQRYQALTIISSIGFAVAGVIVSTRGFVLLKSTIGTSLIIFVGVSIISFARYLFLARNDIKGLSQKIKDLPGTDWNTRLEEKSFKIDWWLEIFFSLFVIATLLLFSSFICF